ncbi:hypothetical protein KY284_011648 [Solanum tuberosum]|nr:hypothetical protein KY284_011648 [Solanum tuberosum]
MNLRLSNLLKILWGSLRWKLSNGRVQVQIMILKKDSTEVVTQSVQGDGVEETISKAAGEVTSNEVDKEEVEGPDT